MLEASHLRNYIQYFTYTVCHKQYFASMKILIGNTHTHTHTQIMQYIHPFIHSGSPFSVSLNTVALLLRKPPSIRTSHDSCSAQISDKRDGLSVCVLQGPRVINDVYIFFSILRY